MLRYAGRRKAVPQLKEFIAQHPEIDSAILKEAIHDLSPISYCCLDQSGRGNSLKTDPILIEKMIMAFTLLESLKLQGWIFV